MWWPRVCSDNRTVGNVALLGMDTQEERKLTLKYSMDISAHIYHIWFSSDPHLVRQLYFFLSVFPCWFHFFFFFGVVDWLLLLLLLFLNLMCVDLACYRCFYCR